MRPGAAKKRAQGPLERATVLITNLCSSPSVVRSVGLENQLTALYIRDPNRVVATHIIRELGLADQEESLISFVPDRHFNDLPQKSARICHSSGIPRAPPARDTVAVDV